MKHKEKIKSNFKTIHTKIKYLHLDNIDMYSHSSFTDTLLIWILAGMVKIQFSTESQRGFTGNDSFYYGQNREPCEKL